MHFKDYLIGLLLIISIALGIWLSIEIQPREFSEERSTDSTKTVTVDTTYVDSTERDLPIDLIPEPDTIVSDTVVVTKTDTFRTEPNNALSKIRRYSTTVSDTLLTGTIKTTVQGYLVTQNFTYTPQYPAKITINTDTRIRETVTRTLKPKPYPSIGVRGATDFKSLRGFEITGSWTRANGNRITYGYNPVLKTHSVGLSLNLRNLFK